MPSKTSPEHAACLTCDSGATTSDGLCAPCAREGSEWCGLWTAGVWLDGQPATTPEQVRTVLDALGWSPVGFELDDPSVGVWLLPLPAPVQQELLSQGHVNQSAGLCRVEVELP